MARLKDFRRGKRRSIGRAGRPLSLGKPWPRVTQSRAFWAKHLAQGDAGADILTSAAALAALYAPDADALTFSFLDGSAYVKHAATPANDYSGSAYGLLTYTAPSAKMLRQSDGVFRFGAHNLYLNSAAPANQSITVRAGASYAITITGSVSVAASGAASGTWTAGTTTFTAATGTLTLGSTTGTGTVHLRRTPSVETYLATGGTAAYALPYEWDSAGNPMGLRVESAATNLLTTSMDISAWSFVGAAAPSYVTSIDGASRAYLLREDSSTGNHFAYQYVSVTSGATYTMWAIVEQGPGARDIGMQSSAGNFGRVFRLSDGTTSTGGYVAPTSYGMTQIATGRWLCWITYTASSTGSALHRVELNQIGSPPYEYTGDGTSGIYVHHVQLEAGALITSIIPTYGATVTRAADAIELASSKFNSDGTQGTLFAEVATAPDTTTRVVARLQTAGEGYVLLRSTTNWRGYLWSGGVYIFGSINVASGGSKGAFAWSQDNAALYANGAQLGTDTSGTPVALTTKLRIGSDGVTFFNRHIKSIMFLPTRLTNAKLAELTT